MRAKRTAVGGLGLTAAIIGVDQATKAFSPHGAELSVIDPTSNPDFALGIAQLDLPIMILVSGLAILVAVGWAIRRTIRGRLHWSVPALLLGGATSNLIDRVLFGSVRDFVAMPLVTANLADFAIVAGFVVLAFTRKRQEGGESRCSSAPVVVS
jgi:lipoprotein signal peptidase